MEYLHTMIRVNNLETTLDFFINKLEMVETNRIESEAGKFTLVFLAAKNDAALAKTNKTPLIELTYNWPDENGKVENYTTGRAFGHLAYRVENIYETCQNLIDKGVIINRPPRDGHMAFIKSPEGVSIELLQKGQSLKVQEPWASMTNVGNW